MTSIGAQLSGGVSSSGQTVTVGLWMFLIGAAMESMVVITGLSSQSMNAFLMKNPDAIKPNAKTID